jgi:hypothetical protein
MPYSFVIDKQHRLVITTATGVFTTAEVLDHAQRLKRDPDFSPDLFLLFDLTAVTELRISTDDVRILSAISNFSPTSRRAIVAPSLFYFGMARMYELTRSSSTTAPEAIQVFSDRSEALQWLDCGLE